ncbi:MAG: transposase [Chthoniobacterales bacterium]
MQYKRAYYHVMARGNRQELIFLNDHDRNSFLKTLDETYEMTGWRAHAWVLMRNHYHLFIQTPEANLVEGMKWFQNGYTRRFNVRHKAWGRLFGDRYKAILVEGKSRYYYETLLDYIHLNPVRAGFIRPENQQSVLDYPWSSIAKGYSKPPSERQSWMACSDGLKSFGLLDTVDGRREMIEHLDKRAIAESSVKCGIPMMGSETNKRASHLQRGWYWGTEIFSQKMLLLLENSNEKQQCSTHRSTDEYQAHELQQAEKWLHNGLLQANLNMKDLSSLKGSHPTKVFLALFIRKKTTVSNTWLADQLKMKSASNVSQQIGRVHFEKLIKKVPENLIAYAASHGF